MSAPDILAILSGGAVGLVLALIGGGGSILATPALLYVVGVANPHVAIGTSALAVSVNAFANFLHHLKRGNVRWRCAAVFAAAGVIGAAVGAAVGKQTDAQILLPLFALLMIVVGIAMLIPRKSEAGGEVKLDARTAPRLLMYGAGVGALSGFFGIGGGFLIVPGLIAAAGMSMIQAIGSSLFSVGAFGATTATSYAADGLIDWRIALLFIGGGIVGGAIGAGFASHLAKQRGALQRVFAGVVFAVAAYMLWRSFVSR
ncbi:MAG TPA: sulfite exporter TauE/SafE family protein [Vitreimonas sp.]|uniref:sulfite exporter TauE/SafE family protein n=1 Tax=Vitreimonas sp. TaxID=3069702 RepID=UPI002D3F0C31|nr:sulfite exporter TauE/SafE family protein [Vitreimonas sp.]HYD88706.1 sulfite exporter TauE/SafE family protein [Vitreimonas sp.]